jgi:hypothetical protein
MNTAAAYRPASGAVSELFWETDDECIVQAGNVVVTAGEHESWTPEHLLVGGLAASIMGSFLRLAHRAGITVLGYASQQRIERFPDAEDPEIVLAPCIVVRTDDEVRRARLLFGDAVVESSVAGMLKCPRRFEPHIAAIDSSRIEGTTAPLTLVR